MRTDWFDRFSGKKVLILGYGLEGKSTYRALKRYCPSAVLQIMDRNSSYVKSCFEDQQDMPFIYEEEAYLAPDDDVAWVFKSPGIPLKDLEGHIPSEKITSQSNEFIQAYRERIIGITGTKGKSTTATFLKALLSNHEVDAELVGNIGKPAFDYIKGSEGTPYFVYELSSHQLETVKTSPKYGVVLNIFEEHLDHYKSFDHYAEAKMNIGRSQKEGDFILLGKGAAKRAVSFSGKKYGIGIDYLTHGVEDLGNGIRISYGNPLTLDDAIDRKVIGHHNMINMGVGILLARLLGYEDSGIEVGTIAEFAGIPHRLAFVGEVAGVRYYNDSISTIPQATIAAIEALPDVQTVLIGGMDRGIDYHLLEDYIKMRQDLIWLMMPDSGHTLADRIEGNNTIKVSGLAEAVDKAAHMTEPGRVCLLSPAAASYGFFKNFEERGSVFEALVKAL